jgi:hypothetical protein
VLSRRRTTYGILANPDLSLNHNVSLALLLMPHWYYFSRPFNMACHNLTKDSPPPPTFRTLLGLGLNFCPTPDTTTCQIKATLERFQRDLYLKVYFAGQDLKPTKLFVRSEWNPPLGAIPAELQVRMKTFRKKITKLFKPKRCPSNLIPHQKYLLDSLQKSSYTLVARTDKNLGPALVDRTTYIHKAYTDHLSDAQTYQALSPNEAATAIANLGDNLDVFLSTHRDELGEATCKFLNDSKSEVTDPYPHFYLTFKIHKTPLKTRPIVSVSGSLLHALGRWLDDQLQPLVRTLPSFIASSWELKNCLEDLPPLPAHARFFTCDAVSMYTNIDTDHALAVIAPFLRQHPLAEGLPAESLISGLELIMRWNIFAFGDTHWKQLSGTAMGTPPACVYATLYYRCPLARLPSLDQFLWISSLDVHRPIKASRLPRRYPPTRNQHVDSDNSLREAFESVSLSTATLSTPPRRAHWPYLWYDQTSIPSDLRSNRLSNFPSKVLHPSPLSRIPQNHSPPPFRNWLS